MFQTKPGAERRECTTLKLPISLKQCIKQKAREHGLSPHAWALKALDEACRGTGNSKRL